MKSADIRKQLSESFPFEKPRQEQEDTFDALVPWIEKCFQNKFAPSFFGVDAPTGVGKSLIAVTTARAVQKLITEEARNNGIPEPRDVVTGDSLPFQVWVVTQNKFLQDQYFKDFDEYLFNFKGIHNYACYHDPGKSCGDSKCARLRPPKALELTGWTPPQYCKKECEYDEVKKRAKYAPILLLNVAKALAMLKNPTQAPPALMIFDEGHNVEAALDNEASFSIDSYALTRLGFTFEKYFQNLVNINETLVGLKSLGQDLLVAFETEQMQHPDDRDSKRYQRLENLVKKIGEILSGAETGLPYVSCSAEKVDLRPLKVYSLFRETFTFPILFLSATLLSKVGFCSLVGLSDQELGWISLDSPFPKENRQLHYFWRMGARPLNYGNMQEELPNLIERVKEVLDRHPDERGIIHTHTYKNAERIYNELYATHGRRFLFPKTSKDQREILDIHARSKNTVLLSPSMSEGVDLKDELCRFSAMCKVPYLPTNDPVVEARMHSNSDWYAYRTAMTAVQAPGRGVRSATDYATTYFLDPGFQGFFNRNKHILPSWFLSSIVKGYRGSY